jgi:hypothetical protein
MFLKFGVSYHNFPKCGTKVYFTRKIQALRAHYELQIAFPVSGIVEIVKNDLNATFNYGNGE